MMKKIMRIISIALLIIFSSLAIAQQKYMNNYKNLSEAINKANPGADWSKSPYAASLPPFCGVSKDPKYKNVNWKKVYGSGLTWSNHYCGSLTRIPICRKYYGKLRKDCLYAQTEGFTYWLKNIGDPNFKLLPYIYVGYGDLLEEIGDSGNAIIQYTNALKRKPKYIKAYKGLIDAYIKLGMLKEAEQTVNYALKIKETKSLLRRKKKIEELTIEARHDSEFPDPK